MEEVERMVKPISTQVHGVLDYLTAGMLVAAPRLLGWDGRVTRLLTMAGASAAAYSLLTRYELGALKALPMPAHLALDMGSGALLVAAPVTLVRGEGEMTASALVGIGLYEIVVAALTQTTPGGTT
jgi:hypothetical protein